MRLTVKAYMLDGKYYGSVYDQFGRWVASINEDGSFKFEVIQ